jgi:hypothetical protein
MWPWNPKPRQLNPKSKKLKLPKRKFLPAVSRKQLQMPSLSLHLAGRPLNTYITKKAVLTREWLAIAVFVCMFLAVVVYGSRQPRTLNYTIDQDGIDIEGKRYAFNAFRSFSVIQDVAWHAIDLEPTQRFMPRLTLLLDDSHVEEIVGRLESQLPRLDRKPDAIERIARYLRF